MKKVLWLIISLFSVVLFSCGDSDKKNPKEPAVIVDESDLVSFETELTEDNVVSFESLTSFLTPNYTKADNDSIEEYEPVYESLEAGSGKSENVIQDIKKLSDYKIKYSSERKQMTTTENVKVEVEDDNPDEPFVVKDWGPKKNIVHENENPSFYVIFSKPVVALSANEQNGTSYFTISPSLKGTYKWYGTRHLSFEASEPADPAVKYTIKVNKDLHSISNQEFSGETTFVTTAEPIKLCSIYGGYIENSNTAYDYYGGALPPYENRFLLRTNYMLTEESLRDDIIVKAGNKKVSYNVELDYSDKAFYYDYTKPKSDKSKKKSNTFIVTIKDFVPHNSTVSVSSLSSNSTLDYSTLKPFEIDYVSSTTSSSYENKKLPLVIGFTHPVDVDSLIGRVHFDFNYEITKANVSTNGTYINIFNLPIDYNESHKIYFDSGIKDSFGQTIVLDKKSFDFKTGIQPAYIKFLESGIAMMEAQFPHKIIFEYKNILDGGFYTVRKINNPIYRTYDSWISGEGDSGYIPIEQGSNDKRIFKEVNLDPYLKDGYGFVRFQATADTLYNDYWSGLTRYKNDNVLSLQVTDLGITARVGINKAVVLVKSLSTDKPVKNADVYICSELTSVDENPKSKTIARAKTDDRGFAVITYNEKQLLQIESFNYPVIYVEAGKDKAVYTPSSHNSWRSNVETDYISNVRKPIQRTFMFVDRGIYRPGEIVSFRGIDKDQVLGSLIQHKGDYTLYVEGSWWDAEYLIDPIEGTLSESGGFYGSFKIPDDAEPGYYEMTYKRKGSTSRQSYNSIYFTVANFERVKFQSSVNIPNLTFTGGDTITGEIAAEYLAGGSLNGASYNVSWFNQSATFTSNDIEAKGYRFASGYSGRNHCSDNYGKLSGSGKAGISHKTEKIKDGIPRTYTAVSDVTDLSNQNISAAASVMVHPAQYYVGLKNDQKGYPKVGTKIEIPYILVGTNGIKLSDDETKSKVKKLSYELTREVWTIVNEQSVNSSIYTRYERSNVKEGSGNVELISKGKILIHPKESGWYTLTVSGLDSNDNYVETKYEFYVTGGKSYWHGDDYSSISLTPDQSQYNPGDTAQILMESALPAGDYIITVEREGIFTEELKHFDSPSNVIEIPIANNYVPVVYVSVSSYSVRSGAPKHQYGEVDLDKPKGYYGVTPLFINPYVRAFTVTVESDKATYKPGEEVTLTLTAKKGDKPIEGAELTVMAVDRGVVDLINYHVPNPIEYFYNKYHYSLSVIGGDSRNLLIDPVTYSIKDLQGGDADDEKDDVRKDFKPTAFFEPELTTDKNGEVVCKFKMPDNLTTYRITAFGVKGNYFALREGEVKVQNPVNIQAVQPRKLRERDTAECGVLITNLEKDVQEVTVSLEVKTPTKNTVQDEREGRITLPGKAFVDGKTSYTVKVAPNQSSVVYFNVGAEKSGTVELIYSIKSKALTEKLVSPIKIERPYVYETVTMVGSTNDKTDSSNTEAIVIPGFADNGKGELAITLDATRLGLLGSAVNYVFDYPYGCLEQQSARVLPLVAFEKYIDVFGLDNKVGNVRKCVTSYTNEWKKSQLSSGAFPYWPDGRTPNDFVTARIGMICAIALENGYTEADLGIDITKLKSYLVYSLSKLSNSRSVNRSSMVSICYTLSLLDSHSINGYVSQLISERDKLSLEDNALLGLIALSTGDITSAGSIANELKTYLVPSERSVTLLDKDGSSYSWSFWSSNDSSTLSAILRFFTAYDEKDEMVDRLLFSLLMNQSRGYWNNTSTTASVLYTIYNYIKARNLDNVDFTATASIDGNKVMENGFKGVGSKPKTLVLPFEKEVLSKVSRDTAIPISFNKKGTGSLYYTVEMKYAIPSEMQISKDSGIKLVCEITDLDTGKVVNKKNGNSSLINLESGKTYRVKMSVESIRDRYYVALRSPIPSGGEIIDSTLVTASDYSDDDNYMLDDYYYNYDHYLDNKNVMDNEVQFYWDFFGSGETTVTYTFRAARRGIYPVPPATAECMYEPEIYGRTDGYIFVIK